MAARKKTARKKTTRKALAAGKSAGKAGSKSGAKSAPAGKRSKATAKRTTKKAARKKAAPAKPAAKKATRKKAARRKSAGKAAAPSTAFPEIEALAELMEKHGLHEVSYAREADGSSSLHVSKGGMTGVPMMAAPAPVAAAPAAPAASAPAAPVAADAGAAAPAPAADETLHAFKSPMVGTFYRAPSPEAAAFANTGDNVDPNSVVCIIEAMKVMNEINPDIAGEIVSIEVENGEAVEFGQTLMLLRPR